MNCKHLQKIFYTILQCAIAHRHKWFQILLTNLNFYHKKIMILLWLSLTRTKLSFSAVNTEEYSCNTLCTSCLFNDIFGRIDLRVL